MKRLLTWTGPPGFVLPVSVFAQLCESLLKPFVMNHRAGGSSVAEAIAARKPSGGWALPIGDPVTTGTWSS
ncbi:MAG: hypothetical protein LAQ69_34985 [Acidobacteriia bacterium]|nr:hypothetical protein [Terriglobia bacterium]